MNQKGFTLIEAVVASALFAFFISSILGVYVSTLRLDSRTRAQRAVIDNGQFIMDFLAKEVRNGRIDYYASACNGTVSVTTNLCLINQSGLSEDIYAQNPTLLGGIGTNLIISNKNGTSNLNSNTVTITKLEFLVSPAQDPFTPAKDSNEQPHVTVVMQVKAVSARDPVTVDFQSTFSENYYPSRQ